MASNLPYNPQLKTKAKFLRNNSSKAEILLWTGLRRSQMQGFRFHRQKMIANFIVDFYCKDLKLAIEVDDKSHDLTFVYDGRRTKVLEGFGITVLRFSNKEVLEHLEGVLLSIRENCKKIKPSP